VKWPRGGTAGRGKGRIEAFLSCDQRAFVERFRLGSEATTVDQSRERVKSSDGILMLLAQGILTRRPWASAKCGQFPCPTGATSSKSS